MSEPITGAAFADPRTKDLVKRLEPGQIAVINHRDLDRVAAETLAESGIVAVINADISSSGRYPNEGPVIVLEAGIVLVDGVGEAIMSQVPDGTELTVHPDGRVTAGDSTIATGTWQTLDAIHAIHDESRKTLGKEFIKFIENTAEYFDSNQDLVSDDLEIPDVGISFEGRHVLMVVRGHDYREDLTLLRNSGYVAERKPLLIGVDGGADALLELGMKPDIIVGDFDSVSEPALRSGAKLVVHAFPNGRAPGAQRLDELGLDYFVFKASGTSEDIAMLMAYNQGAELIVAVGTHSSMVDFLDKGRSGMASTILTRMKVGPALVDAKGVSRLYQAGVRKRDLLLLVVGALIAIAIIIVVSDPVRLVIHSIWSDLTG